MVTMAHVGHRNAVILGIWPDKVVQDGFDHKHHVNVP